MGWRPRFLRSRAAMIQAGAFAASSVPAVLLLSRLPQRTRYDIVPFLLEHTGFWALSFLLLTLLCTPVRRLTGWRWPALVRRLFGLFAFFYASAHAVGYLAVGQKMHLNLVYEDMLERPFVALGLVSYLLLVPLALTSTRRMVARLGHGRWTQLHRLIYPAVILGLAHFVWGADDDKRPLMHRFLWAAGALVILRLVAWAWRMRSGGRGS